MHLVQDVVARTEEHGAFPEFLDRVTDEVSLEDEAREQRPDGETRQWNQHDERRFMRRVAMMGVELLRMRAADIMLADLSQYTLVDKGGVQAATSMHVAFLTDQMVFRITYRVDGKPMWTVPMAPFAAGGLYKSPFVALQAR